MGIQINGQTDTISAIDGALTVSGADLPTVTNLNATGIVTATGFVGNITGNVNATGVSTIATLNVTQSNLTNLNATGIVTALSLNVGIGGTILTTISDRGIGIGTNSYASPIQARFAVSNSSETFEFSPGWDTYNGGVIEYLNRSSNTTRPDLNFYTTASGNGSIKFWTGGSERFRITGIGGSVGIGITNPSSKFEVQGGQFRIRASGTYSEPTDNAGVIGYDSLSGDLTISARSSGGSTAISFRTSNSGTGAERVRIDSSGRVTRPFTPHIFGSVTNTSTATNSFANSMNVVSSTELTFSNSRITVPVAGLYLITFCTISSQDSSRKDANILINGTQYLNMLSEDTTTGFHYRGGSLAVKLAANDYIQFYNQSWYANTTTSFEAWRTASVTFLG
jgi:hypothetical protein